MRGYSWCALMIAVALLSVAVLPAAAQTAGLYFVATTGSDSAAGTEAQPFRTINRGLQALKPGDTLLVKAGLYAEELNNAIPSGESWERPVRLQAYPGHEVTIMPASGARRVIYLSGDRHHIIIDGFILDGTYVQLEVIKLGGLMDASRPSPHNIRISNNEIRNAGAARSSAGQYRYFGAGILATGRSNYIEYLNNVIHSNGTTDYDHGLYHTSSYSLIEGNIVFNNKGTGIKIGQGQEALDNIVRNNLVYDNNRAQGADGRKSQGRGIGVYAGSGTLVYNNVVWGAHHAGIDVTYGGNNARIFNNTVYSTDGWGIIVGYGSAGTTTAHNTLVRNNIVYQTGDLPAIINQRGVNTTIEHNLSFGRNAQIGQGGGGGSAVVQANLVNTDPLFADVNARNFALRAGSPAIDAGMVLADVPLDFTGRTRPQGQAHDLGAFEFNRGAVSQPPAPQVPPEIPAGPVVQLVVSAGANQPGSPVDVALHLHHMEDVYGLQASCQVNPAVLAGTEATYNAETVFNGDNSLLVNQGFGSDGRWLVAATRVKPHTAFSGAGTAFTLRYVVQSSGESAIDCDVLAVDVNGRALPAAVMGAVFLADGSVTAGEITPGDDAGVGDAAEAVTVPVLYGDISGSVRHQSRADHSGITVRLLQAGVEVAQTVTDAAGGYHFVDIPAGAYSVLAGAAQHLTAQIEAELTDSPLALGVITLRAGDVDDNGSIDIVDASLIGANFGLDAGLFPAADLNRDGIINIADLVLVGGNFGLSGQ